MKYWDYPEGQCCNCEPGKLMRIVKKLPSGHYCHKHNQERLNEGKEKKVYSIPKESIKRGKENREYEKKKKTYLLRNPECMANVIDEKGVFICTYYSVDVHHRAGRIGKLLMNEAFFLAVCRECHKWIELHPRLAKAKGLSVSRLESKQEIIPLNE